MLNKIIIFLFLISPLLSHSQDYLDVLNVSYARTGETSFENSNASTNISIFETKATLPIVLNQKTAFVTGFDFSIKKLQLFPNYSFNNLYYTRLKVGLNIEHNDQWTGTYIMLPVLASDYTNISSKDIYMGAIALWTYKKRKNLSYKFGLYPGNEAYGYYITPLLGIYYCSTNSAFEFSALLPGLFDINYSVSAKTKLGIDYKGTSESFKLHNKSSTNTYTENVSLELSTYIQNNSILKNLLLRLKIGTVKNKYDVYDVNDKINLSITPLKFGDNRTKLNYQLNSSAFLRFEAIYRFDIPSK